MNAQPSFTQIVSIGPNVARTGCLTELARVGFHARYPHCLVEQCVVKGLVVVWILGNFRIVVEHRV